MGKPHTFAQLRQDLTDRGRDPYSFLLPEDSQALNPESRYLVSFLADGRCDVTLSERGVTHFHDIYPDEVTAVTALDARLPRLVYGPPSDPEEMRRSKQRQEATRQRLLAKLRQTQHSLDHGHPSPDSD